MTDLRQHLDQARTLAHEGRYWAAIDTLEEARLRISRASADPWSPPEAMPLPRLTPRLTIQTPSQPYPSGSSHKKNTYTERNSITLFN